MVRHIPSETFSDLYHEVCCTYDLCKSAQEGRHETTRDCQNCKQATRHQRHPDQAVWDDKLRAEFKKLKGNDNTEDRKLGAGGTWV